MLFCSHFKNPTGCTADCEGSDDWDLEALMKTLREELQAQERAAKLSLALTVSEIIPPIPVQLSHSLTQGNNYCRRPEGVSYIYEGDTLVEIVDLTNSVGSATDDNTLAFALK